MVFSNGGRIASPNKHTKSQRFLSTGIFAVIAICCAWAVCDEGSVGPFTLVSAQQYDPGSRMVVVSNDDLSTVDFQMAMGAAINVDATAVVVGTQTRLSVSNLQVDFTYTATGGQTVVQMLETLQTAMNNPSSDGYQIVEAFYEVVSIDFYGLAVAATTTTTTTTTTVPATTQAPTAWMSFAFQMASSSDTINTTALRARVAAVVSESSNRVYIISTEYYNFIYANVTVGFSYSTGNITTKSPADLVAAFRKDVGYASDSTSEQYASAAARAFVAAYTIDSTYYYGYTPTIPLITVTQQGTDRTALFSAVANAVGTDVSRLELKTLKLAYTGYWNFTFIFTNDGSPNSYDLAILLQEAFFYKTSTAYTTYLAALNSPSQYFDGLIPIYVAVTTTTAVPLPSPRAVLKIQLFTTSQAIVEADFISAIAASTNNAVSSSRLQIFSLVYNRTAAVPFATVVVYFTDADTTSTDSTLSAAPADLLATIKSVLQSSPASAGSLVFQSSYPILAQSYVGYTIAVPFRPLVWLLVPGTSANTATVISVIANAVNVSTSRIGDLVVSQVSTQLWNISFRFTNLADLEAHPMPLELTVLLQQAFFAQTDDGIIALQSTQQYFESLTALTTAAPFVNKNVEWRMRRTAIITNSSFISSIALALNVALTRVVLVSNKFVSTSVLNTLIFTFTDEEDGTAQSRYNLTYNLMLLRFERATSPTYSLYLGAYDITYESYGDWVTMLTTAPPTTNPNILFAMNLDSFNVNSFRTYLAFAVGTTTDRIATVDYVTTTGQYNYTFQFVEAVDNTTASASSLAEFLWFLMYYKRDTAYLNYLERFNVVSAEFENYVTPTLPPDYKISIVIQMNKLVTEWVIDEVTGVNKTIAFVYVPVDLTQFEADMVTLVGTTADRFAWYDPAQITSGAQSGQYFRFLPMADTTTLPTSLALTKTLQYNLAARVGPNIVEVYARYNITGKRYDGIDGVTDAAPTTTRNPYLPPDPTYYSPYGPEFNRSGLTTAAPIAEESSDKTLIYAIVFGVLGAIVLAGGGTLLVKFILSKTKSHKATKYAQV